MHDENYFEGNNQKGSFHDRFHRYILAEDRVNEEPSIPQPQKFLFGYIHEIFFTNLYKTM